MIKLTFCLRRLPTLTQPQFLDYWFTNHSPLVRKYAAALRIRRYIQLVPIDTPFTKSMQAARYAPMSFDGVCEAWFDSVQDLVEARDDKAMISAGRELIEDEKNFIDLAQSPIWYNEERAIIGAATVVDR